MSVHIWISSAGRRHQWEMRYSRNHHVEDCQSPISVSANETLSDVDLITFILFSWWQTISLWYIEGPARHSCRFSSVQSIEQHGLDTFLLKVVHHHVCADDFTLGNDALLFETSEQILCKRVQIIKFAMQEFYRFLSYSHRWNRVLLHVAKYFFSKLFMTSLHLLDFSCIDNPQSLPKN